MKTLRRSYTLWIFLFASLLLQGCIYENLDACPTTGITQVKVLFTKHTGDTTADWLDKEVTKVDLFFFNKEGVLIKQVVDETGPFLVGYTRQVELPEGDYQLVVWANLYKDTSLEGIKEGTRCYEQARLTAVTEEKSENKLIRELPTTLLYSKVSFTVIPGNSILVEAPLTLDTKNIRLQVDFQKEDGTLCPPEEHPTAIQSYIYAHNGQYDFNNSPTHVAWLTYLEHPLEAMPTVNGMNEQQNTAYTPPLFSEIFRTHRLTTPDAEERLILTLGNEKVIYNRSLIELIQLTGHYDTQEEIDRESTFDIKIRLHCETWAVAAIYINGWLVIETSGDL